MAIIYGQVLRRLGQSRFFSTASLFSRLLRVRGNRLYLLATDHLCNTANYPDCIIYDSMERSEIYILAHEVEPKLASQRQNRRYYYQPAFPSPCQHRQDMFSNVCLYRN